MTAASESSARWNPMLDARWELLQKPWLFVACIAIMGALFRMHSLGRRSLWIDEAVSVALAQAPWSSFWREVWDYESNMVFYYLLLRGWIHLGHSEFAIRSMSVAFGVAAIPAIYLLGKLLFNRETGRIGAALLAVHAAHIQFSQEARSYSLLLLCLILSTYFFALAIETAPRRTHWIAYLLLSTAAVYSHVLAVLILGAQWLSLGFVRHREMGLRTVLFILGSLAVLVGPMVVFLLLHNSGQIDWIPRPTVRLIAHGLGFVTGGGVVLLFLAYVGACMIAAVSPASDKKRTFILPNNFHVRLLLYSVIFPIAFLIFFSLLYKPLFSYRYLGLCVPPMVLLAAHGVSSLRRRLAATHWDMPVALVVLLGLSVVGIQRYYRDSDRSGNDWRSATRYLLKRQQSGDAVIFYIPAGYRPFAYYAHRGIVGKASEPGLTVIFPGMGSNSEVRSPLTSQRIDQLTSDYKRIWVVLHHEDVAQRLSKSRPLSSHLGCEVGAEFPGKWPNGIRILLCSHRGRLSASDPEASHATAELASDTWIRQATENIIHSGDAQCQDVNMFEALVRTSNACTSTLRKALTNRAATASAPKKWQHGP